MSGLKMIGVAGLVVVTAVMIIFLAPSAYVLGASFALKILVGLLT